MLVASILRGTFICAFDPVLNTYMLCGGTSNLAWDSLVLVVIVLKTLKRSCGSGAKRIWIWLFKRSYAGSDFSRLFPTPTPSIYFATMPRLYKSFAFSSNFSFISSSSLGRNILCLPKFPSALIIHSSTNCTPGSRTLTGQVIDFVEMTPWWWKMSYRYLIALETLLITVSIYYIEKGRACADLWPISSASSQGTCLKSR